MRAASGKQSNASMHASYTRSEYFILPEIETYCQLLSTYSNIFINSEHTSWQMSETDFKCAKMFIKNPKYTSQGKFHVAFCAE